MSPTAVFLESCLVQMRTSQDWFDNSVLPLSLDQLRWRPRPGSWSIAECLDHLNRTFDYYLSRIEHAIEAEHNLAPTVSAAVIGRAEEEFLKQAEPPTRSSWKAPAALLPSPVVDPGRLAEQFPKLRERYAWAVLSAASLDLGRILISGSLHPPVHSLGATFAWLAAHERRHLWQAEQLRTAAGFPLARNRKQP